MDKIIYFIYYLTAILIGLITIIYLCVRLKKVDILDYNINFYTYNLLEQINKILIKIIFFFFALIIINYIFKTEFMIGGAQYINIVNDWTIKNKEAFNTILGAFLASSLGIIVQVMINKNNQKKEQSKYSKVLYNDLSYSTLKLDLYKDTINLYTENENNLRLFDKLFKKINFDTDWRNYYSCLTDKLPISYYNKIIEIYSLIERFNVSIDNKEINQLRSVITDLKFIDAMKQPGDVYNISNKDLLEAFSRLSKNKKVKTKILYNLIQEIKIKNAMKKYSSLIEDTLYKLVLTSKESNINIINVKLKESLKNQNNDFNKINDKVIDRTIFEVSLISKKTKLVWGEYIIIESNVKIL